MARGEPKLVKTTGQIEPFQEDKLRRSLSRSGVSRGQADGVVAAVKKRLRDGMATNEVFRIAHRELRHEGREKAARYSLQRAMQRLGPDGFPFESFIAELWRREGYRVKTGVLLNGRFVRHEVDLVGLRDKERRLGECKFRSQSDGKVDVKIALLVHARAADLKGIGFRQFWLVTNGRFTKDALTYGEGVGLQMLSWDHPKGSSLRDRIDSAGLHPITVLSSLHAKEHAWLLRKGLVLCKHLKEQPEAVDALELSHGRAEQLWLEVEGLVANGLRDEVVDEEEEVDTDAGEAAPRKKRRRRGRRGGRGRRNVEGLASDGPREEVVEEEVEVDDADAGEAAPRKKRRRRGRRGGRGRRKKVGAAVASSDDDGDVTFD